MRKEVYSGRLKLFGESHEMTLRAAHNYANSLKNLERFEEARSLLRKTIPVARRVFGENDELTIKMGWTYAEALYKDEGATLNDLREAVTTQEDVERVARRVLGSAHPVVCSMEGTLREARETLRTRETSCTCVPVPPPSSSTAGTKIK